MVKNNCICQFCGQVLLPGKECDCPQAMREQKIKDQVRRAKEEIDSIFARELQIEGSCQVIGILKELVEQVAKAECKTVRLVLPCGVCASLSLSVKGAIKIARTVTTKNGKEVEEG